MQAGGPSWTARLSLLWERRDRSQRSKKDSVGGGAECLPLSRTPGVRRGHAGAWGPQGCSSWTPAGTSQGAQPWCCRLEGPRPPSARPTYPSPGGCRLEWAAQRSAAPYREGDLSQPARHPSSAPTVMRAQHGLGGQQVASPSSGVTTFPSHHPGT